MCMAINSANTQGALRQSLNSPRWSRSTVNLPFTPWRSAVNAGGTTSSPLMCSEMGWSENRRGAVKPTSEGNLG